MLYVDTPSIADMQSLINHREPGCVSIYLPTTPLTKDAQGDRIQLRNLTKEALEQLAAIKTHKKVIDAIADEAGDLIDDDEFWKHQANSLAVFISPNWSRTFRLANRLQPCVEVSDRFHLKPLLRAVSFANRAFVLALSENEVKLYEIGADLKPLEVRIDALPKSAAAAVGKSSINDPSPSGRIQGNEGQKVRLKQYSRQIDAALRPLLSGLNTPLILASTQTVGSIYRSVNSYPHLLSGLIEGNPDKLHTETIDAGARKLLDEHHAGEVAQFRSVFDQRGQKGRSTAQISDAARAATFGAVETLLVDMDHEVHGRVSDEDGKVEYADKESAQNYDILDEIARRVINGGGRVVSVRQSDLPSGAKLAAILRYNV
jgi:hypothetical protein